MNRSIHLTKTCSRALLFCGAAAFATMAELVACGGTTGEQSADGGQDGRHDGSTVGDSGVPLDSGTVPWGVPPDGGPWSAVCPENQPTPGTSCSSGGLDRLYCEYGNAWWNRATIRRLKRSVQKAAKAAGLNAQDTKLAQQVIVTMARTGKPYLSEVARSIKGKDEKLIDPERVLTGASEPATAGTPAEPTASNASSAPTGSATK